MATSGDRNLAIDTTIPRQSLHTAQADSITLSQRPLSRPGSLCLQHVNDDLSPRRSATRQRLVTGGAALVHASLTTRPSIACSASATASRASWFENRPLGSTRNFHRADSRGTSLVRVRIPRRGETLPGRSLLP